MRSPSTNGFVVTVLLLAMGTAADAQQVTAPLVPLAAVDSPSPSTERERLLLERIEQLERRLTEVEARVHLTDSPDRNGAEAATAPGSSAAAAAGEQEIVAPQGGVKLVPHAVLVGSAAYNTYGLI